MRFWQDSALMNSRAERADSYSATEWWDERKEQEERSATSAKAVNTQNFIVANPYRTHLLVGKRGLADA